MAAGCACKFEKRREYVEYEVGKGGKAMGGEAQRFVIHA